MSDVTLWNVYNLMSFCLNSSYWLNKYKTKYQSLTWTKTPTLKRLQLNFFFEELSFKKIKSMVWRSRLLLLLDHLPVHEKQTWDCEPIGTRQPAELSISSKIFIKREFDLACGMPEGCQTKLSRLPHSKLHSSASQK